MFGRDWEPGEATIVSRRQRSKEKMGQRFSEIFYEYVADVRPDDGADVFRSSIDEPFDMTRFHQPEVGESIRVVFHPRNHKVKFDMDDPEVRGRATGKARRKAMDEEKRQFDEALHVPPGTPITPITPAGGADAGATSGTGAGAPDSPSDAEMQAAFDAIGAAEAESAALVAATPAAEAAGEPAELARHRRLVSQSMAKTERAMAAYEHLRARRLDFTPRSTASGA